MGRATPQRPCRYEECHCGQEEEETSGKRDLWQVIRSVAPGHSAGIERKRRGREKGESQSRRPPSLHCLRTGKEEEGEKAKAAP